MLFEMSALPWWLHPAIVVVVLGLTLFGRGLSGGRYGARGLLRREASALGRAEGWRMTVLGLMLTGLGLAWFYGLQWLLFLSLGIGFVELQEASMVIRAWKAGERKRRISARRAD